MAQLAQALAQTALGWATYSWHALNETMFKWGSQEFWLTLSPIIAYWVVAGFYELLELVDHPSVNRWRITRTQRGRDNPMSRWHVFRRVLVQQLVQSALGAVAMIADPQQCHTRPAHGWAVSAFQFVLAMFVMDTYQYWLHRYMHTNTFLYKHIHSTHHKLLIPYAMGALYNHPAEAMLLDTIGAGVSMYATGMSCRLATAFFTFATIKTVLDHCNLCGPWNPVHSLFPNRTSYHDVHHDIRGIKSNYSQPFFTYWDHVMGTYIDPASFQLKQEEVHAKVDLAAATAAKEGLELPHAKGSHHSPDSSLGSAADADAAVAAAAGEKVAQEELPTGVSTAVAPLSVGVTTRSRARQASGGDPVRKL